MSASATRAPASDAAPATAIHACCVRSQNAQVVAVDPALEQRNVTLLTNAYVSRLETSASGREVTKVHVRRDGNDEEYTADIVVSCIRAVSPTAPM